VGQLTRQSIPLILFQAPSTRRTVRLEADIEESIHLEVEPTKSGSAVNLSVSHMLESFNVHLREQTLCESKLHHLEVGICIPLVCFRYGEKMI
jgi:hypothetical protein